jgi:hypothetical protein
MTLFENEINLSSHDIHPTAEAAGTSETCCQTTWCNNPEDSQLHIRLKHHLCTYLCGDDNNSDNRPFV